MVGIICLTDAVSHNLGIILMVLGADPPNQGLKCQEPLFLLESTEYWVHEFSRKCGTFNEKKSPKDKCKSFAEFSM